MTDQKALHLRVAQAYAIMSDIRRVAFDAQYDIDDLRGRGKDETQIILNAHADHLETVLPEVKGVSYLRRHIGFNMIGDYRDIVRNDLTDIEGAIRKLLEKDHKNPVALGFEDLLHPEVAIACLALYQGKHFKQAVITGYDVLRDTIRKRTGLTQDTTQLANAAFSGENPRLIIRPGDTDTAKSLREGYANLFRGAFMAVRNVYIHDGVGLKTTSKGCAQHLIFISMLLKRAEKAVDRDSTSATKR